MNPRHDIYGSIHKGLRAFMAHALVRAGRLDVHDAAELAEVTDELRALLAICRSHLRHENEVIHPAIEARAPGGCATVAAEHVQHVAAIAALEAQLASLPGDAGAAQALYRDFGRFVAENFEHMQREETAHNAALWATHSDAEIRALEQRIVGSLAPDEAQLTMRWMLPHLNPDERAALLRGMRAGTPPEAFDGVLGLVRPLLGGRDWRKLSVALGL